MQVELYFLLMYFILFTNSKFRSEKLATLSRTHPTGALQCSTKEFSDEARYARGGFLLANTPRKLLVSPHDVNGDFYRNMIYGEEVFACVY